MEILKKIASLEIESEDFGFYWPNVEMILSQIKSEITEIEDVLEQKESKDRLQEEIGDLIHATLSLCIYMRLDAEETLRKAAEKYEKRFGAIKALALAKGLKTLKDQSIEANMQLWNEAKKDLYSQSN